MLTIELFNKKSSNAQSIIQIIANIEAIVQPQDAWMYQTLITLLEQDSIDMLIVYEQEKKSGLEIIRWLATAYIKLFLSKLRFCVLARIPIINVKALRHNCLTS
ncbi:hypothetical protein Psyaliredsea_06200 [Psychrobacter alimentarius]